MVDGDKVRPEMVGKVAVKFKLEPADTVVEATSFVNDEVKFEFGPEMDGTVAFEVKLELADTVAEAAPFMVKLPALLLIDPVFPVLHCCKELLPRLVVPGVTVVPTVVPLLVLLIDAELPARTEDDKLGPELVVPSVVVVPLVMSTPVGPANISEPSTKRSLAASADTIWPSTDTPAAPGCIVVLSRIIFAGSTTNISLAIVMVASGPCGDMKDGLAWAIGIVKSARLRSKGIRTKSID